ncbi:HpcH/HpaI aldolase/citrate lyase family protein [Sphingomicrobium sediminis]|uniref:CoA ester lyase n=1 Tax=Sphingomicrobium sediminis TaxID=2950949 RepID=A0A9X2J0F6_9SPHN|nr:CoA ester lyase [Sphingomicrobium sediminis]MCM8556223.1 CoA ester lyase [Sphingomicrobium sediminis]
MSDLPPPRSWLFVPADSEKKIDKALQGDADAIIFDLEDSVAPANKKFARDILKGLGARDGGPRWWVRVNPMFEPEHREDLKLFGNAEFEGIVLPKAESAEDLVHLSHSTGSIPIHAIVTETPASLFNLGTYAGTQAPLAAMSWGAEDLSSALGARSKYDRDGRLAFTYQMARSLCLAGAVAAGAQPIDGVHTDIRNLDGLKEEARAAASEGFTGKLAIHPAQVPIINDAFTPSDTEVARAKAIVDAFAADPGAGVLDVGGKMVDRPHLTQAQNLLARAKR